jgi:DNA-binding transcriptional MerR regulator
MSMVKDRAMLISEFSRSTGLSPDTIRFYVKRGLLRPETGLRGGSNPYQEFGRSDLARARLIQLARSLGFTLREIAGIAEEVETKGLSRKRRIAILEGRLAALDDKATELARLTDYLRAKIAWMREGERGPEPEPAPVGIRGPFAGLLDGVGSAAGPARRRRVAGR